MPSWSSPVRNITGSAKTILHEIPLPAQRGLSASAAALFVMPETALMLPLGLALPVISCSEGLDIAMFSAAARVAILLASIVDGSVEARERELRTDDGGVRGLCGLCELRGLRGVAGDSNAEYGGLAVVGVERGVEIGVVFAEEKVEIAPSTRFAFCADASLFSSTRNLDSVFGVGGAA